MTGRPTKFTADRKAKILEALQVGASRRTAAAIAGVGEGTLRGWMARARESAADSAWAKFAAQVEEAEAHPKTRALAIIYNAMEERPDLAWKFIERREHGFAPPQPNANAGPTGPVTISLTFPNVVELPKPVVNEAIDVEEVPHEPHSLPDTATPD